MTDLNKRTLGIYTKDGTRDCRLERELKKLRRYKRNAKRAYKNLQRAYNSKEAMLQRFIAKNKELEKFNYELRGGNRKPTKVVGE